MRRERVGWSLYMGIPRSPEGGDRPPLSPAGGATGPPAAPVGWAHWSPEGGAAGPPVVRWGGDRPFFSRDLIANLNKKNLHLRPVALWGATGGIFKIFQNRHI